MTLSGSSHLPLTRGGGSVSELWCFNDENLAHEIFRTRAPIIAGIGHKQDDTIAGLVADVNAATPTECGILATPVLKDVRKEIDTSIETIDQMISHKLLTASQSLRISEMELDKIRVRGENELISIDLMMNSLRENLLRMPQVQRNRLNALNSQLALTGKNLYQKNLHFFFYH